MSRDSSLFEEKERVQGEYIRTYVREEMKLEMLGSIVSHLASPRKILGENFFEHSGWHKTSRNT